MMFTIMYIYYFMLFSFDRCKDKRNVYFIGLGGTCVNVGCIPKKLMHQAALLGIKCCITSQILHNRSNKGHVKTVHM